MTTLAVTYGVFVSRLNEKKNRENNIIIYTPIYKYK